jgi:hypothetical protein
MPKRHAITSCGRGAMPPRSKKAGTLDHDAMQRAPLVACKRRSIVHGAAVVPHQYVALAPAMAPRKPRLRGVSPQVIEQGFRFVNAEADQVCFERRPR